MYRNHCIGSCRLTISASLKLEGYNYPEHAYVHLSIRELNFIITSVNVL